MSNLKNPKKFIEVALPLDDINAATILLTGTPDPINAPRCGKPATR
jgi:hypothetical protein